MICAECRLAGWTSILQPGSTFTTCMGWSPYYDEQGTYHSHDPNTRSTTYSCSNGHRMRRKWLVPCPNCDYGKEEEEALKPQIK